MFKGKKILLAVTGSIAAYKVRFARPPADKGRSEVKVVMTPAAKDFITPLTLSTVSKNPVITELFSEDTWSNHVMLGTVGRSDAGCPLKLQYPGKNGQWLLRQYAAGHLSVSHLPGCCSSCNG